MPCTQTRFLTPQRHEYGEENRGWVIKQVTGTSSSTCCTEFPVATHSVTQGTHGDVVLWITDLHAGIQTQKNTFLLLRRSISKPH